MSATSDRVREIFVTIVNLPPELWEAHLLRTCGANDALRERVQNLLAAHKKASSFLEPAVAGLRAPTDEILSERPGTVVASYKLLEQIGEGGFGVVFMAEQQQPIRRKVALKVLKAGMDTRQVVARFEAERQALALMDHPNIAKVLDAGETSSGRPYFVMELVHGVPITDYCDQGRLTPRERLALFAAVCHAVQHAHQKAIIHRDLKPSNVLTTLQDGVPVVKVIDFGIAKALGQKLTDKTLFTNFAQIIGTPLYLSPEQAALSNVDVDTRSDIFSLGVLLYELLTGTTPFERERFKKAEYDEIRRIIREEEPPRPSTRISTLGQAATTVSAQRRSDPRRLAQFFRGELDWIVMKALEKDRNRRYETASAFAADVQRFLHNEPVLACPPSAWYRLRKFARRNQAALAAAAGILALAIGLLGGLVWFGQQRGARRADTERSVSAALAQAEMFVAEGDKQTDHPERWQATARLALAALERAEELLAAGVGTTELTAQVGQVRAAVDAAVADSRLLVELERIRLDQTRTLAKDNRFDFLWTAPLYAKLLGKYGLDLGTPEATGARVRASRLREPLLAALDDWSRLAQQEERRRLEQVIDIAEPADAFRARWTAARELGGAELVKLAAEVQAERCPAGLLVNLARDLRQIRESVAAERLLRAGQERHPGDFWINHDLGMVLLERGSARAEEAVGYLRVALALRGDSPGVHLNLGVAMNRKDDLLEAMRFYRSALRLDSSYAAAHTYLGNVLVAKEDLEGAIREYQAALQIDRGWGKAREKRGDDLYAKKDLKGAVREYQAALERNPKSSMARADKLEVKGDWDGAIGEYRAALEMDRPSAVVHLRLASVLIRNGELDDAIRELKAALAIEPENASAHAGLGQVFGLKRNWQEAIRECRAALRIAPKDASARNDLALALRAQGKLAEAVKEFESLNRWNFGDTKSNLAVTYARMGATQSPIQRMLNRNTMPDLGDATCRFLGHDREVTSVAFAPDGKCALSGSRDGTMRLWDVETARELRTFIGHLGEVRSVAFFPDSRSALSAGRDHSLRLWDLTNGKERRQFHGHTGPVWSAVISSDGQRVLSASWDASVRLWDVQAGVPLRVFRGSTRHVNCVAFSPDCRRAVAGGADGIVRLWDIQTGTERHRMPGHTDKVWGVAFSPNDEMAISGSEDKTARLWDLKTGKEIRRLEGHTGDVNGVAFSPDGKRCLSCSDDNTVRVWDVVTGKQLRRLRGHLHSAMCVSVSRDAKFALSGSSDTTLCLWRMPQSP